MSGSRKSLKNQSFNFNPRAENDWSKDGSKFGQRMLEKMGWSKGQGIGLNNQGTPDNIKIRFKLDNKGLGFNLKEDQIVKIQDDFSQVLSQLREISDDIELEEKISDNIELEKKIPVNIELEKTISDNIELESKISDNIELEETISDNVELEKKIPDNIEVEEEPLLESTAQTLKIKVHRNKSTRWKDTISYIKDDKKEELLNRYRENYRKKILSLHEELTSCELDGRELDSQCIQAEVDEKEIPNFENFKLNLDNLNRNLTKAEKIVYKARLLKMIQSDGVIHDFGGSNLSEIKGYGNEDANS